MHDGLIRHDLEEILEDHDGLHSSFQIDNYIVGRAGGTLYGMYKQAVRELYTRWETMKREYISLRRIELDIESLETRTEKGSLEDNVYHRRLVLDLMEKKMDQESLTKRLTSLGREFGRFLAHARKIRPLLSDDFEAEETGFRLFHLRRQIAVDKLSRGSVNPSVVEAVYALPPEHREGLMDDLRNPANAVEWLDRYEPPQIHVTDVEIPFEELRRLL